MSEDSARHRGVSQVIADIAMPALPAAFIAGTLAARDVLAPGGVAPWAKLVAALLAVGASGLALIWSRADVSWRERRGIRVWALATMVGAALLVVGLGGRRGEQDGRSFRAAIREICEQDRSSEVRLQARLAGLRRQMSTPDSPDRLTVVFDDALGVIQDAQREEGALLARVKALEPPSDAEETHRTLVADWDRKLDGEIRDVQVARAEAAEAAGDPAAFLGTMRSLVAILDGNPKAESDKDALLRELAVDGCRPTP